MTSWLGQDNQSNRIPNRYWHSHQKVFVVEANKSFKSQLHLCSSHFAVNSTEFNTNVWTCSHLNIQTKVRRKVSGFSYVIHLVCVVLVSEQHPSCCLHLLYVLLCDVFTSYRCSSIDLWFLLQTVSLLNDPQMWHRADELLFMNKHAINRKFESDFVVVKNPLVTMEYDKLIKPTSSFNLAPWPNLLWDLHKQLLWDQTHFCNLVKENALFGIQISMETWSSGRISTKAIQMEKCHPCKWS